MDYLAILLLSSILATCFGSEMPTMNFKRHFNALSERRHPHYADGVYWRKARDYIKLRYQEYGLHRIEEHVFNTTVNDEYEEGINLVGVVEGSNVTGPVIVVGADYDTGLAGNYLQDNTGGVACLLETMHVFMDRILWNPNHLNFTVIFVAFDLNTKEHLRAGNGRPGSYMFLHDWLVPYLKNVTRFKREIDFRGAIILDSVTTYNSENGTQNLPIGFEASFPNAFDEIKAKGERGDFIGLLYPAKEEQNPIKEEFVRIYNKDRKARPFRLQEMEVFLSQDTITTEVLDFINHQAQYHFWTRIEDKKPKPMPAFLLFDTDKYRVDPTPDVCDVTTCSVEEFLTPSRETFMSKTTETLVNTLLSLQTTPYEIPNASSSLRSSFYIMAASLAFALVYMRKYFIC